jgi:hypothetical protein
MSLPAEVRTLNLFLPHSPYCPNLVPTDFQLSGPLKDVYRGRRFSDDDELQQSVHEDLHCFIKKALSSRRTVLHAKLEEVCR